MGILISGMEMPFTCWACEFGHIVNCAQWKNHAEEIVLDKDTKRHPDCPLAPVPPHGDLIDRNETIKALWKALYEYEDKTEKQFVESSELDVADWILHRIFVQNMSDIDRQTILQMPAIIPAEPPKGETDE